MQYVLQYIHAFVICLKCVNKCIKFQYSKDVDKRVRSTHVFLGILSSKYLMLRDEEYVELWGFGSPFLRRYGSTGNCGSRCHDDTGLPEIVDICAGCFQTMGTWWHNAVRDLSALLSFCMMMPQIKVRFKSGHVRTDVLPQDLASLDDASLRF